MSPSLRTSLAVCLLSGAVLIGAPAARAQTGRAAAPAGAFAWQSDLKAFVDAYAACVDNTACDIESFRRPVTWQVKFDTVHPSDPTKIIVSTDPVNNARTGKGVVFNYGGQFTVAPAVDELPRWQKLVRGQPIRLAADLSSVSLRDFGPSIGAFLVIYVKQARLAPGQ